MLKVPYEKNRGNTCALSCYTMTTKYFFPEITFEQLAEISDWQKGYVIWGFKFWLWIMEKGIKITNYDLINLEKWADEGFESLQNEMSKSEYDFLVNNTYSIDEYAQDIKKVLAHPNFTFRRQRPTWKDLQEAFNGNAVCEVVLDSVTLDKKDGDLSLHRVVILDVMDNEIIFHDPRTGTMLPERKENIQLFKKAWLDVLESPELCIYEKK